MNIIAIIMILFCLVVAVFSAYKEKNLFNPVTLLFGFWTFVFALHSLNLSRLLTNGRTYAFLAIGLACFALGFYLVKCIMKKSNRQGGRTYRFNYKLLYILYGISFAILLVFIVNVVYLMAQGQSLYLIRKHLFSPDSGSLTRVAQFYIIDTLVDLLIVCCFCNLFFGANKKQVLLLTVILVLATAMQNGGRLIFYRLVIDLAVSYLIFRKVSNKRLQLDRKTMLFLAGGGAALVACVVLLTVLRQSSLRLLYDYFAGCVNLFDYRLSVVDYHQQYTHGFSFFGGILRPLFTFLSKTGIMGYPQSYLQDAAILKENVEQGVTFIADGIKYNAFVTPFLYFYLDLRVYGIILGSLLYGGACSFAYHAMLKRPNIKNIALYLLIAQELFTTMIRWQFNVPSYCMAVAVLLFGFGLFTREKGTSVS